jgi:hypothetical protein
MQALEEAVDALADRTRFSGVVGVDHAGSIELAKAYWFADRGHRIPNTIRHAVRHRERREGPDGAGGGEPDRGGLTRSRHNRLVLSLAAISRSSAMT